jgi:hypothetical protein
MTPRATPPAEREASYALKDRCRGMTELEVATLAVETAIDGLPMVEQIAARGRYRAP